jgi:hypothetical protein
MSALSPSSKKVITIITSIFIVLIMFTMKREAGEFALGYPWTFFSYSYTVGMQRSSSWSIQPAFFIIEWLMIAAILIVVGEGVKRIRR